MTDVILHLVMPPVAFIEAEMSEKSVAFLSTPLVATIGQPLRVVIYSRIADGIRSQVFALGSLLPNEAELGVYLGVSRTVVREALMLLEEDGLIVTRRGIGRFVATKLPRIGLEHLRPFEEILSIPGHKTSVKRISAELQVVSEFSAAELQLDEDAKSWFWESVVSRGEEKIAIVQEHLPAGKYLTDLSPALANGIESHSHSSATMLSTVNNILGHRFTQSECEITVGVVGATRGRILGLRPADPILIMTQVVFHADKPLYLAKYIVSAKAGHLSLIQTLQS